MCVNPSRLPDGTLVACRVCWQCVENYVNDWVGRCTAESKVSVKTNVVTLTYGRGQYDEVLHERAVLLTYSDVQKYIKLLRWHGHPCRYFAVGEYGKEKGRAHWHVILFWQKAPIKIKKLRSRIMQQHWPHGTSYFDDVDFRSLRYAVKYMRKDLTSGKQAHFAMSKKPPIGAEYFRQRAWKFAEAHLSPQDLKYSFGEVRPNGVRREYYMTGKTVDIFFEEYLRAWAVLHGGHEPYSEVLENWRDSRFPYSNTDLLFERREMMPYPSYRPTVNSTAPIWREALNAFICKDGGRVFMWRKRGDVYQWQEKETAEKGIVDAIAAAFPSTHND